MRKYLSLGLATLLSLSVGAQTFTEWQDAEVNAVNRAPMHTDYFAYETPELAAQGERESSANYMSLNGQWKFNWVRHADARPTDFWKPGYNDRAWDTMPVPGIWEMNGYGDPQYVNIGYPWREQWTNNPPQVPTEENHVGSYRRTITVPASWKGKDIIAHFGSVTSNIYLWVNGKYVGYSEDSKLEAEFDLTRYLRPGEENLIAFQVFRWCDGTYLEDQDFFRFSGVARDCYLYAREKRRIEDIRVTPDLDADYRDGTLAVDVKLKGKAIVTLRLKDAQGKEVASATTRGESGRGHPRESGLPQNRTEGCTDTGQRPTRPLQGRQPPRDGSRRRLCSVPPAYVARRADHEAAQHQRRTHLPLSGRPVLVCPLR